MAAKISETTIGYVEGRNGQFGRHPFYSLELPLSQCAELDTLLGQSDGDARRTTTLVASYHQPDRLRLKQDDAPAYEASLAPTYVRGDMLRVQGKENVSCNLAVSAKFGVPALRQQLNAAADRAREFVLMRVPTRNRDVVEFVPDVDLPGTYLSANPEVVAGTLAAAAILGPEDFSDWEKKSPSK
jgi:hypothetical protein